MNLSETENLNFIRDALCKNTILLTPGSKRRHRSKLDK